MKTLMLQLRISDSVLDEKEWSVFHLMLLDGVVTSRAVVWPGAYSPYGIPDVGATLADIEAWSRYDGTGTHPEQYHEVRVVTPGDQWLSMLQPGELEWHA